MKKSDDVFQVAEKFISKNKIKKDYGFFSS